MHAPRTITFALLALALAACEDKPSKPAPAATPPPAVQAQPSDTPTRAATASPVRDRSKLDACAIVKDSEVAKLAGATLLAPTRTSSPVCIYALERGGTSFGMKLAFWDPEPVEAMFAAAPPEQRGEKIDGPWDEAYLRPSMVEGELSLSAVWRGDIAMEVLGDRKEAVIEIAKLAASRLPPR